MDGIMDGFSGVVQEIDLENNMVKVTVSAFFGRETLVELELDQVEPVTD
jgi:transcriptional antiterminator NusG